MQIAVLGIDLGKNSCSVVGLDRGAGGAAAADAARRRGQARGGAAGLHCRDGGVLRRPPSRPTAARQGHEVRLMSPEYVRPYVKAQKNDDRDAEAIAEAATRPTMRFVALKADEQLDLQTLHRVRDRLVGERTALINQLRAMLLERGIVVPQGRRKLEQALAALLDEAARRTGGRRRRSARASGADRGHARGVAGLDRRIGAFDEEFAARARRMPPHAG